jgi:nicotinate-nucleotide adenylyltransferase
VNIALFGGTFDPIHTGHLRAAKAAAGRFGLDRILFVPSAHPPHKQTGQLTPFAHRFAMVALACAADQRYVPSLLEAPTADERPQYSVQTLRALRRTLASGDRLFFIIGVDAFLDLPHWREPRALLDLVDFIVVSRPGSDARKIWSVLPPEMTLPSPRARAGGLTQPDTIRLHRSTLHILRGVDMHVASRDIREMVGAGRRITGLVPAAVEKYISKEGLYQAAGRGRR